MIKLALIDVDGTLHGPGGVPECAWEAAARARRAGIHLSLATGRPSAGVSLDYAKLIDPGGLHIFHQGAAVVTAAGVPVYSVPLPQKAFHGLVDLSRSSALPLEVYTAEGGFYVERYSRDLDNHGDLLQVVIEHADLQSRWFSETVIRLQWVVRETPAWARVRRVIDRAYLDQLSWHVGTSPATPGVVYASLLRHDAGKLAAARWLAGKMGIDFSQVAMIGDGENDLELIRAAGLGIAMGNAPESVKRTAARVVASVESCGLGEALDWIIELSTG
ncbi:HAD family hydrolase [Oceanithermus sp.]